jgi:hypothetical protein
MQCNDSNSTGSMKQLYFLHIPKTAGRFVKENIALCLSKNNISSYTNTYFPHGVDLKKQTYIAGHFGTYPIETIENIDVACIVRNPIDARISYFNFRYDFFINKKEYAEIDSYVDKLRYYLFSDPEAKIHDNYQARYICNPADSRIFNTYKFLTEDRDNLEKEGKFNNGKLFTWFVENEKTSLEFAKQQIDSFDIVGTVDNMDLFMSKKSNWFEDNYSVGIKWDNLKKINSSIVNYREIGYTTTMLKDMLSLEEKDLILKNNYIDYAIYEYVKGIEND